MRSASHQYRLIIQIEGNLSRFINPPLIQCSFFLSVFFFPEEMKIVVLLDEDEKRWQLAFWTSVMSDPSVLQWKLGWLKMWKAAAGQNVKVAVDDGGDDWETDPDFEVSPSSSHLSLLSPVPHVYSVFFVFPEWRVGAGAALGGEDGGRVRTPGAHRVRMHMVFSCLSHAVGRRLLTVWLLCCSIHHLRETVSTEHTSLKQKELENMPKASHGYGGRFGVQQDRMDKVGASRRRGGKTCTNLIPSFFSCFSS